MEKIERSPRSASPQDKSSTQLQITKELLEGFLYGKKKAQLVDVQCREKPNRKRKWDCVEDECNGKLQSLWCEECCKHTQGECPIHQSSQPKLTYAVGSFPPEVRLCTSTIPEYLYGACAAKQMPRGTWIGPYEGRRIYSAQSPNDQDNAYLWEIYENGQFSHFLDGTDESTSSWMRFIRCARHKTEQNMSVIQYGKNIYYYATRNIEIGEEMLVWYHESYYQFWGVPLMLTQQLDAKNGPPIPQGIAQPLDATKTSSSNKQAINSSPGPHSLNVQAVTLPQSGKPSHSPESHTIPQQYRVQKSFHFPKQISTSIPSKRYSPPSKLPYPAVSPQLPSKTVLQDSPISPAVQHLPPGVFTYPPVLPVPRPYPPSNIPAPYPALSNGSAPYPPLPKGGIPYPPPARKATTYPPMSPQFAYPPQSRYPPTPPGTILYQPASMLSQYEARPPQLSPTFQMTSQPQFLERQRPIAHTVVPANVQILPNVQIPPVTRRSPPTMSPRSPALPRDSQIPPTYQIPPNVQISSNAQMPPNFQVSPNAQIPPVTRRSPSAMSPALSRNSQIPPGYQIPPNVQISPNAQMPPVSRRSPLASSPGSSAISRDPQIQQLSPESKIQDPSSHSPRANQQAIHHSPRADQQPTNHSPPAEQQPANPSPREQAIRAYYETDNYTSRGVVTVDRSSTSSETDQWAEVKENMPLAGTRDIEIIETRFKPSKHPQALKSSPLQNLTPSIHNKRQFNDQLPDKQHNQVSSTVRTLKDQEVSWKCGQCEQMFAQQVTLRMHVCLKAPDHPFHCGHCTNTFATSFELREHVETHNNDRPFKCGFCSRSFAGATTLGNHMRTHTGQRPYECKVCGQTFAIATQLSRHLKPPGECGLRQKDVTDYNQNVDITVEQ